jgi:hypothetical protein
VRDKKVYLVERNDVVEGDAELLANVVGFQPAFEDS